MTDVLGPGYQSVPNDGVTPYQWRDIFGGGDPSWSPEKRMASAILVDAVRCLDRANPRTSDRAEQWVKSNEDEWPFAFVSLCELFGLNVEVARRIMLARKARYVKAYSRMKVSMNAQNRGNDNRHRQRRKQWHLQRV